MAGIENEPQQVPVVGSFEAWRDMIGGFPLCAGHYEAERRRVLREEVGP